MVTAAVYDELIEYLLKIASPAEILAFEPSEEAQQRAEYLVERNNADELTADEQAELEQVLYFDGVISVLKARAAKALKET